MIMIKFCSDEDETHMEDIMEKLAVYSKWAEINLNNLIFNLKEIRQYVNQDTKICAVVKANGYGHGALEIAGVLLENGVDMIAVSSLNEAIEIRKKYHKAQTLILGYTSEGGIEEAIKYGVVQTIYTYEQAVEYSEMAEKIGFGTSIHIKLDTGMNRIGFQCNEQSIEKILKISKLPNIKINGIFSHFAVADEKDKSFTYHQLERFNWAIKELEKKGLSIPIKHISNSAAIVDLPDINFNMVRPGIILYGIYPSNDVNKKALNLKPVMSLKTKISNIKTLSEEGGISYGFSFRAPKGTKVATIPIGYADGYTRLLSNKGEVLVRGQKTRIIGTICMDQCMIDVTGIDEINIGDEVILFGSDGINEITVDEVAQKIGTISYEVLCMVGRRVPRVYIKDGEITMITDYLE